MDFNNTELVEPLPAENSRGFRGPCLHSLCLQDVETHNHTLNNQREKNDLVNDEMTFHEKKPKLLVDKTEFSRDILSLEDEIFVLISENSDSGSDDLTQTNHLESATFPSKNETNNSELKEQEESPTKTSSNKNVSESSFRSRYLAKLNRERKNSKKKRKKFNKISKRPQSISNLDAWQYETENKSMLTFKMISQDISSVKSETLRANSLELESNNLISYDGANIFFDEDGIVNPHVQEEVDSRISINTTSIIGNQENIEKNIPKVNSNNDNLLTNSSLNKTLIELYIKYHFNDLLE